MPLSASYVIAARRTANGRIGGLHRNRRVEELSAPVIEAVLKDTNLNPDHVDEVIVGNTTGGGGNPARLIALTAGLSENIPAYSIDRQCASGLEAVMTGVRLVASGHARVVLAGGAESPSTAPWRVAKPKSVYQLPRFYDGSPFVPAESSDPLIIEAAEHVADKFKISRKRQDQFALQSHQRAINAHEERKFVGEIVLHRVEAKEARDETSRPEISLELLAQMPTFFYSEGTITSGNSCSITDGAAFALIVDETVYADIGKPPALRCRGGAVVGTSPELFGIAPVPAINKLFEQANGITLKDVGHIELSETFAVQALASLDQLGLKEERVNRDGGAIALGHPFGASSAVLIARLFTRMVRNDSTEGDKSGLGLASVGATGGLGVAALFEAVR